ncbi:matrilin-4-like isoform X1 [Entelurus aequoreus]|uniref:matrilin-4-like n=1 Tax=Entelurus aequoreus TaxID=161455 RepID=UPI002B1D8E75|nr:matrilin-4-like [Entelurus aequoreus]XP_061906529.1 matrilin-4-like isoform X1 [Entelurus aequoreus]XP_061906538.1 matrilin-4-like isoform X1 [Entelurus aequoreus]XP_061906548.1 matrilin-4-like isoform X1 [Entelurus aequoreus]
MKTTRLGGALAFVLLNMATLAAARPKAGLEQKCKSGPVDLVFLIDSSRSVRPHEFETMRKFMIDILNTLEIGPNATRVGVVQYSSQVRSEFSLNSHSTLANMVDAINGIVPLAQGTMTGLAIRYIMNNAFIAQEGDRPKVANVAVIVTDGRPQDRVAEVAAEARQKGIEIYAVGVARADMASLRAMASPPFEDHVFLVESFDLIHQFGLQFQDKLCGLDLCVESEHGCEHICESSPGSYHCLCLPGYTLNNDGKMCTAMDLCAEDKHDCEQICVSSPGVFTCDCNEGFTLNDDKKTCTLINYCSFGNHTCDHECVSVLKGFQCRCNDGYKLLDDGRTCRATDLCAEGKHDCEQICVSSPGVFTCNCNDGFTLNKDKKTCTPIDLCAEGKHDCEQICISSPGVFTCDCNEGFVLNKDKKTCKHLDMCNILDHGCEHRCVSTPGSYYCLCPEGQLLKEDGKTCGTCKTANIDLVLLIDGSKSVRPQNFELVKKFVNQVVDTLDVSAHGTRVGLIQYSSRVRTEFPLNMYHTADEIKAAVMKVEYMEKGTMTGLALKHMLENSFSEVEGARPAVRSIPRIGLVFTDGRSQDDITEYAKQVKEAGITMYAVGVGKAVEDELREIASEPVEKHFYYTTDFSAISTIAENLKLNVCPEESQGEIEVKDPCACENLVEFQQATMSNLEQLTQKLTAMSSRLEQLENQLLTRK